MTVDAHEAALAAIRVVLGVIMVAHGYNHWHGGGRIAGTAGWFESLGLRRGKLQAWASVVTEIGAGAAVAVGFLTPFACAAVIGVMAVAGLLAHRTNGFFVFKEGYEYVLLIAVVAAALAALGPGTASVDHLIGTELTGWAGGGVAVLLGALGTAILLGLTWRPDRNDDAR